ncbi:MAG: ABC transporter ATP-binding protein [Chryseolinea sp.]
MKPILEVTNISKKYRLNHIAGSYLSLRDRIVHGFKTGKMVQEDFWALDDVSFSVNQGESIGIIGANGAGKSTLLKILSKITPPTKGRIISRGRIASLLEVGTGFHPELTGRENIFFNGSLLGMKRKEISQKFDEIVDFAGIENFLDTPLKHYSSGMQLRLAFSVAAFLDPEILIIDEVLAVGDSEFQKKCLGKMGEVSRSGRTILFVSHNMAALRTLCEKSFLLMKGKLESYGETSVIINSYLSSHEKHLTPGVYDLSKHHSKKDRDRGIITCTLLRDGIPSDIFFTNEKFTAEFDFKDEKGINEIVFGLVIKDSNQQPLIGINNWDLGTRLNSLPVTSGKLVFELASLPLYGDSLYYIDVYFGDGGNNYDIVQNAISFTLQPVDIFENGKILNPKLNVVYPGKVKLELR